MPLVVNSGTYFLDFSSHQRVILLYFFISLLELQKHFELKVRNPETMKAKKHLHYN